MRATHFGKIHQDFSHLITTLTTSDINDNIAVGELGHTLGNDSLAASESTRNADSATLDTREERVQHPLSDNEGRVGRQSVVDRSRHTYWPNLHHGMLCLLSIELDFQELLLHRVASSVGYPSDGTPGAGWEQDLVLVHQAVLKDGTPDVTSRNMVADLHRRLKVPFLLTIQRIYPNTTGDVDRVGLRVNLLEGTLNTVVNRFHQTGAKLDRKRLAGSVHRVTDSQAR